MNVPDKILRQIQAHADQARHDREVVGLIGFKDGVAMGYQKVRNASKVPCKFTLTTHDRVRGTFKLHLRGATEVVLVHSHPFGSPNPSWGDLRGASSMWFNRPYAIFSRTSGMLRFWELRPDRKAYRPWGMSSGSAAVENYADDIGWETPS